jgi:hypothetical protein
MAQTEIHIGPDGGLVAANATANNHVEAPTLDHHDVTGLYPITPENGRIFGPDSGLIRPPAQPARDAVG